MGRSWDSDAILASFTLAEANAITPAFADFLNLTKAQVLKGLASEIRRRLRPEKLFRALSLLGGQTVQNEQIPPNDFGRVLAANFQPIFDPGSYEDRKKVVQNAYVGSPRKLRYAGEIDRIIRNAAPAVAAEAHLIEDVASPKEVSHHFGDLPSLRNKILLLIGSVGSGKSTFVDYLRECVLTPDIKEHCAWVRIDLNPAPVTRDEIYPWLRLQIRVCLFVLVEDGWRERAILCQCAIGLFLLIPFHMEPVLVLWFYSALAFWTGMAFMLHRRPTTPTKVDLFCARWGFILLFVMIGPFFVYLGQGAKPF